MNKNFTKEDIIKKHETNIKSAQSSFALVGILGIIYIVRYFITGNFDFYFSLSLPEMLLKLSHNGDFSKPLAYIITAVFFAVYFILAVLNTKNSKWLKVSMAYYIFDCLCLLFYAFVVLHDSSDSAIYIELIIHFFIVLFLSVGVYSDKALRKINQK